MGFSLVHVFLFYDVQYQKVPIFGVTVVIPMLDVKPDTVKKQPFYA